MEWSRDEADTILLYAFQPSGCCDALGELTHPLRLLRPSAIIRRLVISDSWDCSVHLPLTKHLSRFLGGCGACLP